MNILGISGIERAVPFKRSQYPGLDEREYRVSQGHDAAAALICDGRIVAAAAEERFDGHKHSSHFPIRAIDWALRHSGLSLGQIDEIVHSFDYAPYAEAYRAELKTAALYDGVFCRNAMLEVLHHYLPAFPEERVHSLTHHLAHAASAYYTSGWDECLVVVVDAMGEAHGITVYDGRQGQLRRIRSFSALNSIGIFYSLLTMHLGFDFNADEYKIMGLAPYGDPARYRRFFESEVTLQEDGSIRIPLLHLNRTTDERENYRASRAYLREHLVAPRNPEGEIGPEHRDIAAALQDCLNRAMLHVCVSFQRQTGHKKLAMAGGVALNCTSNGNLLKSGCFEEIYVCPASGDDGSALGAALYRAAQGKEVKNVRLPVPFLGPDYTDLEIARAISDAGGQIGVRHFDNLEGTCHAAAKLIAGGAVLAWYRGRMEFGPRALGNRSILADPSHPEMRDRINSMIKKREAFRPFAPAVSVEQRNRWFDISAGQQLPHMTVVVDVRKEWQSQLPAVTHVDGSARVQTVSEEDNPAFHALLKAIGRITGREMVLNTSFNVKGQPMVNSPAEAISTFLNCGIDCLFLQDHIITRSRTAEPTGRHKAAGDRLASTH